MLKFGRKDAVRTRRTLRSALIMSRTLDTLGPAPANSNDYVSAVKVPWGMMLNDTLGDCVCADTGHTLMLRTANTGTIVIPQDSDIVALYEAVGGYNPADPSTDQGCDETAMCQYLETTGFLDHKADAIGTVEPSNLDHIKWCVQLFGACRLGWSVPNYAMEQFDAGLPFDLDPSGDQTIEGGHDTPIVKYDGEYFYVVTWNKLQPMTPAFFSKYCDEAHSELFFDWIQSQGAAPSGLDLNTLASDLAEIGNS